MSVLDHLMVLSYLVSILVVTRYAARSIRTLASGQSSMATADQHFLAGRRATTVEAVFSIAATEFSAMTFVHLPAMAMMGRRGLLWGLFGIILGRWVVSRFLLRNFYRTGLTVFDALSRGIKEYSRVTPSAARGQRLLAILYFFTKLLSVAAGLSVGVGFIARFYDWSYGFTLVLIVVITCAYTLYGGLKAVMRTDILQFFAIGFAGLTLLWIAFGQSGGMHVLDDILAGSNVVAFGTSGLIPVLIGIVTGFIGDFTSHGVEQDFVQKLKACQSPRIASRAVMYSAVLTIALQILFMVIGVALITAHPLAEGKTIGETMGHFMDVVVAQMQDGSRGVVLVGIIAATMSSLDSSLNALSAVLWNDIFPGGRVASTTMLIKLDNAVVTVFASIFAFFVGQNPMYLKGFFQMNAYMLLPLACCFILRFVSYPRLKVSFGLSTVVFVIFGCLMGFVFNAFYLHLPAQFSIISCLIFSGALLWMFEKLKAWI
jgi:SSS family solute:Na+ symporter